MEVQQGRRFQHNCRTDQAGRPHEQGADSCDETIGGPKIRRSLMGSIQDQQLMLEENGFRDHRTDAARAKEPGNCGEAMNEEHEEMAHRGIVARTANARKCGRIWNSPGTGPPSRYSVQENISDLILNLISLFPVKESGESIQP